MPQTDRIGEKAWERYLTVEDQNDAFYRMHTAASRHLLRMACVSNCFAAVIYFPNSGKIQTWSSLGSFTEALALFNSVDEWHELSAENVELDFEELWREFSNAMPWALG